MQVIRRSADRGHLNHGWLDTFHTFSFGRYIDRQHMGFRALRVMNEDVVHPGSGFGEHGHDNMEIVTIVLSGALQHRDSLGNGEVLRPGEFQRMTAGTGIRHSEFNPSATEPVHLYQIWLLPEAQNLEPSYEQRAFPASDRRNRLQLVASRDAAEGSLRIHQDAKIFLGDLSAGTSVQHGLSTGRHAWLQVLSGEVQVSSGSLTTGDGLAVSGEEVLSLTAVADAQILLFDLA